MKKSQIFLIYDSNLSLINFQGSNLSIMANGFFSIFSENYYKDTIIFYMENCSFTNISQSITIGSPPMFYVFRESVSISLYNCTFSSLLVGKIMQKYHFIILFFK